jgi:hypothetical protein
MSLFFLAVASAELTALDFNPSKKAKDLSPPIFELVFGVAFSTCVGQESTVTML